MFLYLIIKIKHYTEYLKQYIYIKIELIVKEISAR